MKYDNHLHIEKESYPCNWPWRPKGLFDVDYTILSTQSDQYGGEVVSLTHRQRSTQENPFFSFL
jgi:hypothetical protein